MMRATSARARRAARRGARIAGDAGREYLDDRGPQLAASISYYALFSVFPLTILLVAVFGLVTSEESARREVTDFVLANVPLSTGGGRREIADTLENVTSNARAFGIVGVAGLVFSASGLMGALRHGLSRAFDVEERRPPLLGKLLDVALVLAVGLLIGLSLVLTLVERLAVSAASELSTALGPAVSFLPRAMLALGQLTPVLLAVVVFTFLYRFVPTREVRWRDCLAGAVPAGVGYELVKTAFSFYVENFASYGAVYGSIAAVIAFAFFVFVSANVFLVGAEVAAVLPNALHAPLDDGPPVSLRQRLRALVRTATGY
jgi:membrane protein